MDAGLKVRLNPDGGNQLNFREALRLYLAPIEQRDEQAEDDEHHEKGESEPRKNVLDDYDYDDDFIDDDEVIEDEVAATPPNEENDGDVTMEDQQQSGEVPEKPPLLHHGFANFWVNKGNLPSKRVTAIPQPPSILGNVMLEHVKLPTAVAGAAVNGKHCVNTAQSKPQGQKKADGHKSGEDSQIGGNVATTSNTGEGSKKTSPTNPASGSNAAKSNSGRQSQTKGKVVQQTVIEEIGKLATLCQTEFGDKKPKLSDPKVQEQLDVMFRAAIAAGVGKLFSDIAKDRRVVALADEVWNRLSFLRVKRANLETLGHALIWSAKEKAALEMVEKTESDIEQFMRNRRELAGGTEGALMAVVFDNEVDTRVYEWYRAKSELQLAKNQLGSRVKSVKKCVGGWVVGLKKTAFQGWSVAEGEIVEAFRRVEEVKIAQEKQRRENERQQRELERQRRENEKLEKKRKREEMMAAAAAAAKRTALEKSGVADKNSEASGRGTVTGTGSMKGNVSGGNGGSSGVGGETRVAGSGNGGGTDASKSVVRDGKIGIGTAGSGGVGTATTATTGGASTGSGASTVKGKAKAGKVGTSKTSGKNNVMKQFAKVVKKESKSDTKGAVNKIMNKTVSGVKNGGKVAKKRVTPVKIGRVTGKKDGEKITGKIKMKKEKGAMEGMKDTDKIVLSKSSQEEGEEKNGERQGEEDRCAEGGAMEVIELD